MSDPGYGESADKAAELAALRQRIADTEADGAVVLQGFINALSQMILFMDTYREALHRVERELSVLRGELPKFQTVANLEMDVLRSQAEQEVDEYRSMALALIDQTRTAIARYRKEERAP
jgi:hypothetical protein